MNDPEGRRQRGSEMKTEVVAVVVLRLRGRWCCEIDDGCGSQK